MAENASANANARKVVRLEAYTEKDFWEQMYEQVSEERDRERRNAAAWRRRALAAEARRVRVRKAALYVMLAAAAIANITYWVLAIAGK